MSIFKFGMKKLLSIFKNEKQSMSKVWALCYLFDNFIFLNNINKRIEKEKIIKAIQFFFKILSKLTNKQYKMAHKIEKNCNKIQNTQKYKKDNKV